MPTKRVFAVLGAACLIASGCGGYTGPRASTCAPPTATLVLPSGQRTTLGGCAGGVYDSDHPVSVTVERGQSFTLSLTNNGGATPPHVARGSGLQAHRTGSTITFTGVTSGVDTILAPRSHCFPDNKVPCAIVTVTVS